MNNQIVMHYFSNYTHFIFLSLDKEQIGAKRRKKIPHFNEYFQGGGGPPPPMGGAGGGGFGFPGLGALFAPAFMGFAPSAGTSQSSNQGELSSFVSFFCEDSYPISLFVNSFITSFLHASVSLLYGYNQWFSLQFISSVAHHVIIIVAIVSKLCDQESAVHVLQAYSEGKEI